MKWAQAISHWSMKLQSDIFETASASIIVVDVMSDTTASCICTHDWLSEPRVLVHEWADRNSGWSQVVSHPIHHTVYVA
jgi:hypothetical protein